MGMLHRNSQPGIAAVSHRHGHYEATPRPHRRDSWNCDPCPARPLDSPLKCSPQSAATVGKKWLAHHGSRLFATETAHAPQSQPQRKRMPLSGTDFAAVDTTHPPQTQPQRMKMPLLEVDSPAMGTAYSSRTQPQRREMPLPETQTLAPPIAESSLPSASATALPGEPTSNAPLPAAPPCAAMPHTASRALLLQTADIPPETARLVRCHNPWPTEDVLFCPGDALPAFVTGIPALSNGP